MKKKILYTVASVVIIAISILTALPFVIQSDKIQQEVLHRIENCYVVDASVAKVELSFFPIPHFKIFEAQIRHETFSLDTPEIDIYPSWRILLGQPEIGRIYLKNPSVVLQKTPDDASEEPFTLPENLPWFSVFIEKGALQIPTINTDLGSIHNNSFSEITATLKIHNNTVSIDWNSKPNFAKELNLTGALSLNDYSCSGTLFLNHLNLAEVFADSTGSSLAFITDTSEFSATFDYSKDQTLTLHFDGDVPDFTLIGPDLGDKPPIPFRVHKGDLNIKFKKDFFEIAIKSLDVIEPAGKFQGTIAYYLPENKSEKQIKLDLQGHDIDATIVRDKLLDLVGTNIVAETVCDIVQNGEINSASYYFDDTIPNFEDIKTMTIKVDIERTDIHLKHVPIDLHNAKGKILIKDGDLTGWDITTSVGNSFGTKGSFLVGLGHDNWGLKVDVDIDTNLAELPEILREIIPDENVKTELHLLEFSGRNDGHLHIGDDIRTFNVIVDVKSFNKPEITYGRLAGKIIPQAGSLQVTDSGASWEKLSLHIGNHSVSQTTGHLDWKDPAFAFELTSLKGVLDNNTLFAELHSHETLKKTFKSVLTSIVGSTAISGTIKGHFFEPQYYVYDFDTVMSNLIIKTPVFPDEIKVQSAHARITDTTIHLQQSTGMLFGDSLRIDGDLQHNDWLEWQGNLVFKGQIKQPLMDWIKQKELIPDKLHINTPASIQEMRVKWHDDEFHIAGDLTPVGSDSNLNFKFDKTREITAGEFNIQRKTDTSQIRFFIEPSQKIYDISLAGTLPGQALQDILSDSFVQFDTLSGNITIHVKIPTDNTPPVATFSGNATLKKLHLIINNEESSDHTISFSITGKDNNLTINNLDISYGNSLLLTKGFFKQDQTNGHLNLDLTSPEINTQTVEDISDHLEHFLYERLGLQKNSDKAKSNYNFDTKLKFNFQKFTVPFGEKSDNGKQYQFPITPLIGQYNANQANSSLQIKNSNICGLEVEAFFSWFGETETSKTISLQTPENGVVEMKDFLECFNSNAVIKGPMTFHGKAITDKGMVQKAKFSLISEKGHIYKFAAVAKAISILNIKGWSGSIWEKGYYYNKIELSGIVDHDILKISKLFIDGDGVDIVGKGTFDISAMEYDMVFYVVPFTSVNSLVTKVPIVGRLLGGKEGRIVSVPVKISGASEDPDVSIMDAGEIGSATGRWIWDTVTIPFNVGSSKKSEEPLDIDDIETQAIIPQDN